MPAPQPQATYGSGLLNLAKAGRELRRTTETVHPRNTGVVNPRPAVSWTGGLRGAMRLLRIARQVADADPLLLPPERAPGNLWSPPDGTRRTPAVPHCSSEGGSKPLLQVLESEKRDPASLSIKQKSK